MDQKTVDVYNKWATQYDEETTDFWQMFPSKMIPEFVRLCPTNGFVLDIGCGPGRDAVLLREAGLRLMCIDAATSMVEFVKLKGFEAVEADLLQLPFHDATFDGVWAYTSLLHVPKADFPIALNEALRVLKPSGVIALGLIEGTFEGYRTSKAILQERYFTEYTMDEVVSALETQGCEVVFQEYMQPGKRRYLHVIAKKKN